eukprot:6106256-Pyramimonas_sp.AAC.1
MNRIASLRFWQAPIPLTPTDEEIAAPLPPLPQPPGWRDVVRQLTEFELGAPSHFHAGEKHLSFIDRLFCSSLGWVISQQATSGEVIGIPEQPQAKQISDHAA